MLRAENSRALWAQIAADYRQAWLLRRRGHEAEAALLLQDKLPGLIAAWSDADPRPGHEKKAALNALFDEEEASVDAWLSAEAEIANRLGNTLLPALRHGIAESLREVFGRETPVRHTPTCMPARRCERVRFDDIPAVIDLVLLQQRTDFGSRPVLSY